MHKRRDNDETLAVSVLEQRSGLSAEDNCFLTGKPGYDCCRDSDTRNWHPAAVVPINMPREVISHRRV